MDDESLVPQRVLFVLIWCGLCCVALLYMIWRDIPRLQVMTVPDDVIRMAREEAAAARARNPRETLPRVSPDTQGTGPRESTGGVNGAPPLAPRKRKR